MSNKNPTRVDTLPDPPTLEDEPDLSLDVRLQFAAIDIMPQAAFVRLFQLASRHPARERITLRPSGNVWALDVAEETIYMPDPKQAIRFTDLGDNPRESVLHKYQLPGFVEVEDGDTVIDIGACMGEFARHAARIGDRVVAVEPGGENVEALSRNLAKHSGVEIVPAAVWEESTTIDFHLSTDSTEHSALSVDEGDVMETVPMEAIRLPDLCAQRGIETVDFLKVEAEGAEPEILTCIDDVDATKVAVDCSPERDGGSPMLTVVDQLEAAGYTVRVDDDIVFGHA